MIKFFRKIRQRLLTENKFSNYLLYALGEIVLVIIGILVALQINDWNNRRVEINNLYSNLDYVIEDLEKDKNQLLGLRKQRQEALKFCSYFIDSYLQNTPISFNPKEENPGLFFYERKFIRNLHSFKKVESSKLFQSEKFLQIREKINAYAEDIDRLVYDEERLNFFIAENEREMFLNGSFIKIYEYGGILRGYNDVKIPLSEFDWLDLLKENYPFKAILLRFEDDMTNLIIPQYDKTVSKGVELKLEIEKYLNIK